MTALKIIGFVLAVIALLVFTLLMIRAKLILSYSPQSGFKFRAKYLFFTFGQKKKTKKKKKNAKESKFAQWLKKKLGFELPEESQELRQDPEKKGIYDKVTTVVTLVTLLADEFIWLFKKLRLDKLRVLAICSGDDASDTAMDYGLVCAIVYPMVGYLTANINAKKNAEEVQIGCDFDGNTHFEFELAVSIKTIHLLRAVLRGLKDFSEIAAETTEEAKR